MSSWVDSFNSKFNISARESEKAWRPLPSAFNLDYKLSVKFSCRTDSLGYFVFHNCDFRLIAPLRAYKKFELCLSEQFGIRAYMDGKWYNVELAEPFLQDTIYDTMPHVEKDLISRYLLSNLREAYA